MPREETRGYALRLPPEIYAAVQASAGKESMNTWITKAIRMRLSGLGTTSNPSTVTAGTTRSTPRSLRPASRPSSSAAGAEARTAAGSASDTAPPSTAPTIPTPVGDPCGSPSTDPAHEHRPAAKGLVTKCACGAIRVRGEWRHPAA